MSVFSSKSLRNVSISTMIYITLMLMLLVVLLTLLSFMPVYGQALQADVWTNKGGQGVNNLDGGTYVIGEVVKICINLNMDVNRLKYHVITPDGRDAVYYDGPISAGTRCFQGVEIGPLGVQRVIAEAWKDGQYAFDEVRYNVVGCPSHSRYLGVNIWVINDDDVEVTGWFRPVGISWGDFVNFCWNGYPGGDYFISYLRNELLNPMLGIRSSSTVGSGIDQSKQWVWLKLRVKFRDLSLSDYNLKILRFKDPIKSTGRGFIDEVRLTSFREIWKAIPQPTSISRMYADWINIDAASAPLDYEVYLYPLISIRVRVEDIPPGVSVSILINDVDVGSISLGRYLEKILIGGDYMIRVQPDIIMYNEDVRYRCKNNIYRLTSSGEIVFKYNAEYHVKISVQSPAGRAGLTIDGSYYSFEQLPFEDWWEDRSTHRIIADREGSLIKVSEVERKIARFYGWNDGTSAQEKTMSIAGPLNLIALYNLITQYYVEVKSEYVRAIGSGWYDEGEQISIGLEDYVQEDQKATSYLSNRERMVFQGWSGDLTSQNIKEILTVNSPKSIKAVWKKQYYVETITNYSHVEGSGWYYEGDMVKIALAENIVYTPDKKTRYVFDHWRGDYEGVEKEFSIILNKPLIIEAVWSTQYLVELYTNPPGLINDALEFKDRWITSGELLFTVIREEIQVSNDTKYVFVRWVTENEVLSSTEIKKIVDTPTRIIVDYEPWYYVFVRSDYGSASGSGWYKSGSNVNISIEPLTVGFLITYIFDGWSLDGEYISKDAVLTLTVTKPLTFTARWRTDYTQLTILIVFIMLGSVIGSSNIIKLRGKPLYRVIGGELAGLLRIQSSQKRIEEKLKKLEELYQKGEISEEAYIRIREELESELIKGVRKEG